MTTLLQLLQDSFARHADRPALAYHEHTYTYSKLDEDVRRAAVSLQTMEVKPGDRVVFSPQHKVISLIAHLTTIHVGAVSLPLNPRLTREELRFFLGDSSTTAAIVGGTEWATW